MDSSIYKLDTEKGVIILTFTKEDIPMYENEKLKRAFSALLDEGKNKIVLDLSNPTYISSIVIASLVFMHKRAKRSGGNFAICCIRDEVKEILAMTNLDKIFDIFDGRQEAISQLAKKWICSAILSKYPSPETSIEDRVSYNRMNIEISDYENNICISKYWTDETLQPWHRDTLFGDKGKGPQQLITAFIYQSPDKSASPRNMENYGKNILLDVEYNTLKIWWESGIWTYNIRQSYRLKLFLF